MWSHNYVKQPFGEFRKTSPSSRRCRHQNQKVKLRSHPSIAIHTINNPNDPLRISIIKHS